MRTKKWLKKTFALLLAATMTFAVGITALAGGVTEYSVDDDSNIVGVSEVSVVKRVSADDDVDYSNLTVTIVANVCEDEDGECEEYDDQYVYNGVNGGLNSGVLEYDETSKTYVGSLIVNSEVFEHAGIYHYVVSEVNGGETGVTYDTSKYDVYVYVLNGEEGLYVAYVVTVLNGEKEDLEFTNEYETESLKITKTITGSGADLSSTWEFIITIENCYYGQISVSTSASDYKVEYSDGTYTITVELGNDGYLEIIGLTTDNEYVVKETEANTLGYTTYINNEEDSDGIASGSITSDIEIAYENNRGVITPTGIVLNYLPYILIIICAGAILMFFNRKRGRF